MHAITQGTMMYDSQCLAVSCLNVKFELVAMMLLPQARTARAALSGGA
jgi:hypothetical protein